MEVMGLGLRVSDLGHTLKQSSGTLSLSLDKYLGRGASVV